MMEILTYSHRRQATKSALGLLNRNGSSDRGPSGLSLVAHFLIKNQTSDAVDVLSDDF